MGWNNAKGQNFRHLSISQFVVAKPKQTQHGIENIYVIFFLFVFLLGGGGVVSAL